MRKDRQEVYDMFNGRCAYCGCELNGKFHVDHIEPIRRRFLYDRVNKKWVPNGCDNPDKDIIDNKLPACASCNINKHSMSLEDFRNMISNFINSLNNNVTQYKIAKRYGLVTETIKPIVFYFETHLTSNNQ